MPQRTRNTVAFITAALLLIIGIAGYAFQKPQQLIRVLFKTTGGPVVLDHVFHSSEDAAGIECTECHHNIEGEENPAPEDYNCKTCHYDDPDIAEAACAEAPVHKRCIGQNCVQCHEDSECSYCHQP
jgi:hypothetical protein